MLDKFSRLAILAIFLTLCQCTGQPSVTQNVDAPKSSRHIVTTAQGIFQAFPIPNSCQFSTGVLALGPDKNIWFANGCDAVDRITQAGVVTTFPTPSNDSAVLGIVAGPDGNIWAAEPQVNNIARLTLAGSFSEFPLPLPGSGPTFITSANCDCLWFVTNGQVPNIGRISTAGSITEFSIPGANDTDTFIGAMTQGPDGNAWLAQGQGLAGFIDRINPNGTVTQFAVSERPFGIATGSDGNIWFALGDAIGRLTLSGVVTQFQVPFCSGTGDVASDITTGTQSSLYFTMAGAPLLGRITTHGAVSSIASPFVPDGPVITGADQTIWFTTFTGLVVHFIPAGKNTLSSGAHSF